MSTSAPRAAAPRWPAGGASARVIADRPIQPAAQQPAAHRGRAAVHEAGERVLSRAPKLVSISRLRRVCASISTACSRRSDATPAGAGARRAACPSRTAAGSPRRRPRPARPRQSKPRRSRVPNCSHSSRLPVPGSKCQGAGAAGPGRPRAARQLRVLGEQQLGRLQPLELARSASSVVELRDAEAAAGEVEPCETDPRRERERCEQRVSLLFEQRVVGDRAGRDRRARPCARPVPCSWRGRRSARRSRPTRRVSRAARDRPRRNARARRPSGSARRPMRRAG